MQSISTICEFALLESLLSALLFSGPSRDGTGGHFLIRGLEQSCLKEARYCWDDVAGLVRASARLQSVNIFRIRDLERGYQSVLNVADDAS